jgi:ubiquinol-cytochrome c reductase cytochrome c subunit
MRTRAAAAALAAALALPAGAGSAPPSKVERGKQLYGHYCISCHGPNGEGIAKPTNRVGTGPLRVQEPQQAAAPPLRGVGALAADFYLRTGYMPLRRLGMQPRRQRVQLQEDQIRALVAYVDSLGPGPAIPKPRPERGNLRRGLHLFTDKCAGCHQVVAEGGYVTGGVAPPLENATATQIAEAVRIGPYFMPSFSQASLSDHDVDSLIAYIQYAKHPDDRGGWALGHLGPVPEGIVTWLLAASALVVVCIVIGKRLKTA